MDKVDDNNQISSDNLKQSKQVSFSETIKHNPKTGLFDYGEIEDIDKIVIRKNRYGEDIDSTGETGVISGEISTAKLRKYVVTQVVQPTFVNDLKSSLRWRYRWRRCSNIAFTFRELLIAVSIMLSFTASYTPNSESAQLYALLGGASGVFASSVAGFGSFALNQSKKQTEHANIILEKLGVANVPDLLADISKEPDEENQISEPLIKATTINKNNESPI